MSYLCKICIATKGISGSDLEASTLKTDEELWQHIEKEHHIPVRREGESRMECMTRMQREHPDVGGPNCKCPVCRGQMGIVEMIGLMNETKLPDDNA